ncbi:hypothetical protein DFP72DRAFT_1074780 [Ephemerocybe angulata]|uniref:Uncharacterized protein n=1 Tax=Ephemerocybe angulata TaxID=980116 RepID=A0A8H6HK99_9AGAR|nr:hypothetical protein DFP72DRAFT_1074780 [Tulosesus angulatus]
MASRPLQTVEEYPSLLWIAVPSVLLVSAYLVNNWYKAYKLKNYGIGKGAPGFQTGVRRIRVTPEIAARIRRGEDVSPEEIAASAAKMEEMERSGKTPVVPVEDEKPFIRQATPPPTQAPSEPTNEWLPDSVTNPSKRKKGKRR